MSDSDALKALERYTSKEVTSLLVAAFGLACETRPELMRVALTRVFDVKAVALKAEDAARVVKLAYREAMETAHEVRRLIEAVNLDLSRLEARIDGIEWKAQEKAKP